jgi:ATPase subunit of ABC transporter with duplicated ATPase domains
MLVVSHDRRFLETVCERLWVVDDGLVVPFDGGYRAWREAVAAGWTVVSAQAQEAARLRTGRTAQAHAAGAASPAAAASNGHDAGRDAAAATSLRGPRPGQVASSGARRARGGRGSKLSKDAYRRQRESADAELTRLGLRKNHLELEMANPSIQANFIELRRVTSELADVEAALDSAEEAWLAVEERAP